MKLSDFIAAMDNFAPRETALSFDNVGLLIGTERKEISRVLVALDCTLDVAREAAQKDCDLVLTHHPLLFNAVKRILPDDAVTAPVFCLIRNDIGLFAAHTNLDAAKSGVNAELCRLLGIQNPMPVGEEGIMRIGKLAEPIMLEDYIGFAEKVLNTKMHFTGRNRPVQTVAVMGGAGGGDYRLAAEAGAELYITGECKHNQAIEASHLDLSIAFGGHYETEAVILKPLVKYLQTNTDGVQYIMAETDVPVFRMV